MPCDLSYQQYVLEYTPVRIVDKNQGDIKFSIGSSFDPSRDKTTHTEIKCLMLLCARKQEQILFVRRNFHLKIDKATRASLTQPLQLKSVENVVDELIDSQARNFLLVSWLTHED